MTSIWGIFTYLVDLAYCAPRRASFARRNNSGSKKKFIFVAKRLGPIKWQMYTICEGNDYTPNLVLVPTTSDLAL
jgi:hypothetical protein